MMTICSSAPDRLDLDLDLDLFSSQSCFGFCGVKLSNTGPQGSSPEDDEMKSEFLFL